MNQTTRPWYRRPIVQIVALIVLLRLPGPALPVVVVLALAVTAYRILKALKPQPRPAAEAGVRLGADRQGRPVAITDRQLSAHGLILGASGSGKTTSLLTILTGQIRRGRAVIAIDLKGSPTFINHLQVAASQAGRPLRLWTPDGPSYWNPLALGNPTQLKDKLISTERWTEPHYQRAAERYLQTTLQLMHQLAPDQPATLARVVDLLDPKHLAVAAGKAPKPDALGTREYISSLTPDQKSGIAGLASRLAVITESHTGAYLQPDRGQEINLHQAIEQREVVLFSLNASSYGKLASHLAALIIQDLVAAAGQRLHQPHNELALIAIDEFSALEADNILALLARAREAGLSILLTTQELADLDRTPGLRDQVLGNTALTLAHRQNVPASAELIARLVGTHTVWQHTYQTGTSGLLTTMLGAPAGGGQNTGLGSKRQVEEFRIHPNTIKELPTGWAALITKLPTARTDLIQITPHHQP